MTCFLIHSQTLYLDFSGLFSDSAQALRIQTHFLLKNEKKDGSFALLMYNFLRLSEKNASSLYVETSASVFFIQRRRKKQSTSQHRFNEPKYVKIGLLEPEFGGNTCHSDNKLTLAAD
jgi:hypothetical protein